MTKQTQTKTFTKKTIYSAAFILTIIALTITTANLNTNIVQAGSLTGIGTGIYWDQNCKNNITALEWGTIAAGSNSSLTIFVRNECNSAVSLALRTSNYTPTSASSYITLSWNYIGQTLKPNQAIPIQLTLAISPLADQIGGFSFTTTISATGQ
jgi:hypothetical protein